MIYRTAYINQSLTAETTVKTVKNEIKTQTKKVKSQRKFLQPLILWHFDTGCCKLDLYCIGRNSKNPKYIKKNSSKANILLFHIYIPLYIKYINKVKTESFEYIYWWI